MLKIYLNGELEQSVYDVAIVNPEVKPSSVIVNASLRKAFRELKIMNVHWIIRKTRIWF